MPAGATPLKHQCGHFWVDGSHPSEFDFGSEELGQRIHCQIHRGVRALRVVHWSISARDHHEDARHDLAGSVKNLQAQFDQVLAQVALSDHGFGPLEPHCTVWQADGGHKEFLFGAEPFENRALRDSGTAGNFTAGRTEAKLEEGFTGRLDDLLIGDGCGSRHKISVRSLINGLVVEFHSL